MVKKKVLKLDFFEEDTQSQFGMIGICSHVPDYKLVRDLNKYLGFNLERSSDNGFLQACRKGGMMKFPYYFQMDEEGINELYLIKNNFEGNILLPSLKLIDYFLFLGLSHSDNVQKINDELKGLNSAVKMSMVYNMSEFEATKEIIFD